MFFLPRSQDLKSVVKGVPEPAGAALQGSIRADQLAIEVEELHATIEHLNNQLEQKEASVKVLGGGTVV